MTVLPNGWKKVKLGDVATISSGSTPLRSNKAYFENGNMPWVKTMDLTNGKIIKTDECITELAAKKCKPYPAGTALVAMYGGFNQIGRTGLLTFPASINQALAALQFEKDVCSEYVLFYLNANVERWRSCAASSRKDPNITSHDVEKFEIVLPPIDEQKKIAATLSVWDSAIEKMEKLIKAKECGHAVLMNNMLKKAKTWDCNYLSNIATIKKGKQLNAVDMISDGAYYVMNGGITPSGNTDDWNTAENTISISEGGNSCGFVAFNKEKFWAGGHCYTLIDLSEVVSVKFLFHYLKNMEKEIMAMRVGSGLPNIQKDSISDIEVLYPSKKEQKRISEVLDDSLSEISLLKQQLENYKKQKQGLMQKLLTGQWRVK